MIIVGELINSTRKTIVRAIEQKDKAYLQDLARRQTEAGAHYIDVNAASSGDEIENMKWLVNLIQEVTDTPLCIDSPSAAAIESGLALCGNKAIINSISAEKERWEEMLPLIQKYQTGVVALCMADGGMPETVGERLQVADKLVAGLREAGVSDQDIYLDPLIKPVGVNHIFAKDVLETTRLLRDRYPAVHVISGLSNVSYGLPERRLLNRAFMVMSIAVGMDSFILDPLDQPIMSMLYAARAVSGEDEYCLKYISEVRAGRIKA